MRYEKAVREFNFQNKKKSQEHEDELEELRADKKAVDRKVIRTGNLANYFALLQFFKSN